jgi:hypothetical protein
MTATVAVRSTITANAVRLQDGNVMGLLSIHLGEHRVRSALLRIGVQEVLAMFAWAHGHPYLRHVAHGLWASYYDYKL